MDRRKRKSSGKLAAIIVMLVLCLLSAALIVKTVRNRAEQRKAKTEVTEEPAPETQTAADDAAVKERLSHVFANSGASSEEKYTTAAFDGAIAAGNVCLAMPIVISADGTPYIADDDYIYELTGMNAYLSGMTDGQIAGVKTKGGNDLLKLSDVFDKYGKDVTYVIEIKYTGDRNITAFTETVKKYGFQDVTSVSSLYYAALSRIESEFPEMQKLFLCEGDEDFNAALSLDYIDTISVEKALVSDEKFARVHEAGKKAGAWTLNTEEEIRAALDKGADSYYTDEGALAVSVESSRQKGI